MVLHRYDCGLAQSFAWIGTPHREDTTDCVVVSGFLFIRVDEQPEKPVEVQPPSGRLRAKGVVSGFSRTLRWRDKFQFAGDRRTRRGQCVGVVLNSRNS